MDGLVVLLILSHKVVVPVVELVDVRVFGRGVLDVGEAGCALRLLLLGPSALRLGVALRAAIETAAIRRGDGAPCLKVRAAPVLAHAARLEEPAWLLAALAITGI